MHYVIRYRLRLVRHNLLLSFPDKSDKERREIEDRFYHWFADLLAEIIHGYRADDTEMRKRISYTGLDLLESEARRKGGVILMLGHLGCWEWYADIAKQSSQDFRFHYVYRRLKSESADKAMLILRGKRGGDCIEKNLLLRRMVEYRKRAEPQIYCMLSDQKPSAQDLDCRVPFLHQETPFITGSEVLAKKFDYPVLYVDYEMTSRGHYTGKFRLISANPKETQDGEITRTYAQMLERNIIRQPHIWLWSHNRFKYNQ